jgi:hypothetical protein
VTIVLFISLMVPARVSWLYMDHVFLNYRYSQIRRKRIQQRVDKVFTMMLTGYLVIVVLATMTLTTLHVFALGISFSWVYYVVMLLLGIYDLIWILSPIILSKRYMQLRKRK